MTDIPAFDERNWFWQIGEDANRFWSSADTAYVAQADPNKTTRVPDETQLIAVLTNLGLPHPAP